MVEGDIHVVSAPYLPGYRVVKTLGFTWGLVVRSRGIGRNIMAALRTLPGGEIKEYGTAVVVEKEDEPSKPVRLV